MDLGLEFQKTNVKIIISISRFRFEISKNYSRNKNQHPRDTLCANFRAKQATLSFLTQFCPEMALGLDIQKTNFGIKISILEITCVPILRQRRQLLLFRPKFAQKLILGTRVSKI